MVKVPLSPVPVSIQEEAWSERQHVLLVVPWGSSSRVLTTVPAPSVKASSNQYQEDKGGEIEYEFE